MLLSGFKIQPEYIGDSAWKLNQIKKNYIIIHQLHVSCLKKLFISCWISNYYTTVRIQPEYQIHLKFDQVCYKDLEWSANSCGLF